MNKLTGYLLDNYALTLGLIRTKGEDDESFRNRLVDYLNMLIGRPKIGRSEEDQVWADIFGWD